MNKLLILLISINLLSCKGDTELLTNGAWILSSESQGSERAFYKKSDNKRVLYFYEYGDVDVADDDGKTFATCSWKWLDEEKKHLVINTGKGSTKYYITTLSSTALNLADIDYSRSSSMDILMFKHLDDKEWLSDSQVESFNSMLKVKK